MNLAALVNRFLLWPLPASVCSDPCVTQKDYPHGRWGTSLLTADEARQMLGFVLEGSTQEPTVTLSPISIADAKAYFEQHSAFRGEFNMAIAATKLNTIDATDPSSTAREFVIGAKHTREIVGVIAFTADGTVCRKEQISTDGSAFIGSLLYGGWVRAAMALGYKTLTV